ncbi:hypothetical protein IMZ08_09390 [Bacillus luteolus]|uniref:Uncharacterized protein n=1 Tax=Litchfieldia luteola TaxID=682179 RepID=A0ABR9QIE8_9BACI|nr:hypothetical protein [Cytobacillus luteolus]MBE4908268.1 hypothetical protein [Cytobacillus luteolus]MBP1943054.1 hypothetical protein [Cytobacillus luteolus]
MTDKDIPMQELLFDETGTSEVNEQLHNAYFSGFVDQYHVLNSTAVNSEEEEI